MALLNDAGNPTSAINLTTGGLPFAANTVSGAVNALTNAFSSNVTGLPSSQVSSQNPGNAVRNIAYWFVPEVGVVNMYINPQSMAYNYKKLITPERTKGGYVVQYWGEELTTLNLRGHTGSSGVEGLNVLFEVYRSEQYLFDPIALTMAAQSSISGMNNSVDSSLGNLGGLSASISNATGGVLQLDPASQNILPRYIPSLASMALGVELYWSGWIFRGYFTSFNFTESAERIGMFDYDIAFTVTQRRGYRFNSMPWQHSATNGPSSWQNNQLSFSTLATPINSTTGGSTLGNVGGGPFG